MRAGRMDRLITFEKPSENSNDYNDPRDVSWVPLTENADAWADKIIMRGNESAESGKQSQTLKVRWKVRWRTDVTADMRIAYDNEYYYITEPPREIGRRDGLEIITEKRN